jgi:ATP-binding cassette, subfamily F, member 3
MINIHNLTLRRGIKTLLDDASVRIDQNDKIGLVGRNGAGKTSLLKLLMQQIKEESGQVLRPKKCTLAHLSQELPTSEQTAFAFVRDGDHAWANLQKKITQAEQNQDDQKLAELYGAMEAIDGFMIDTRVHTILTGLGFTQDTQEKTVGEYSGGWQMRLQLAHVLMAQADLLLLDEPTNHLDLETILWLEKWLRTFSGTVLIISHDREFLDRTTTNTIHIAHQKLKRYKGNYTAFTKQFHEALALQQKQNQKTIKKQQHLQKFIDRFKAKASKAKQAKSRMNAIQKLQLSQDLYQEKDASFDFFPAPEAQGSLVTIEAALGYPPTIVLHNLNLNLYQNDRIGVIGVNGSGKSTLLKTIAQQLSPITGTIAHHPKTKIGYFSQQQVDQLQLQETPINHMRQQDSKITDAQARTYLGSFGFTNNQVFYPVKNFSGGEKARLALALLIWHRPNVLVLDEPTNHLDMQMRNALIFALQSFSGAVLLVSHDRYFLECCINELWHVEQGTVTPFQGTLKDYTLIKQQTNATKSQAKKNKKQPKNKQKALHTLEQELTHLHQKLTVIEQNIALPKNQTKEAQATLKQYLNQQQELQTNIAHKEQEWLTLSEQK